MQFKSTPHQSILGPVQFSIFINDLNDGIVCALKVFGRAVGCAAAIQRYLDKIVKW